MEHLTQVDTTITGLGNFTEKISQEQFKERR